jgi:anti-anti-sigma regulatory factor
MAPNFTISIHGTRSVLHVKLAGDFDQTSAYDLLNMLQRRCRGVSKVLIHTSRLKRINPLGCNIFNNNLQFLHSLSLIPLEFTGKNALQLARQKTCTPPVYNYCSNSG